MLIVATNVWQCIAHTLFGLKTDATSMTMWGKVPLLGVEGEFSQTQSARMGQLLSAAGLDPVCLGNVVEKSRGIGIGGCVVTWEVGFLPEIEVAMMGTVVREILKRVRRWIYESVKIRVSNFTRGQIVDWIGWAMGILSSWGSYGGLMDGVVWASVGHAPDYVRDAVDIEKRGIEGEGWTVRTGCTRNKKHGGDLEKDGLKWEKKREWVSAAMGWLRAGRQSEVGDELWVVTPALWDRAGTFFLGGWRNAGGFCVWLRWIRRG